MVLAKRLLTFGLFVALSGCVVDSNYQVSSRATEAQDLVPATADFVAFADARAMMANVDGIVALDNSGDVAAAWDQVRAALGAINMDLERDLDYAVVYASKDKAPVATAVGAFDIEAIADYLAEHMPEARRNDLDGLTTWTLSEGPNHGVFGITEDGSRAMAGQDVASLQAALSVRGGSSDLVELAGDAMEKDSWVVVRNLEALMPESAGYDGSQQELLMRSVAQLAVGGSLTAEEAAGVVVLHPRDGVEADDLAALLRGVMGAMRLQDLPEEARAELEEIDVESDGGTVVVTGAVTRDLLESMMR